MIEWWLFFPGLAVVMVVFALIGWFFTREDESIKKVLDFMIEQHLDEWEVSKKKIMNGVGLPSHEVEDALNKLQNRGIMYRGKHGFALLDPLVFLTRKGYSKARRLTKNDNILYGGYQVPYETNGIYILSEISFGLIGLIIIVLTNFNIFGFGTFLGSLFGQGIHPLVIAVFIFAMLIVLGDVMNNFVKYWTRERYSVVIGEKSGVSYDLSLADDLSGRIERHALEKVDIDMSMIQKIVSSFKGVPIGNLRIWKEGSDKPISFTNIPYPREAFFIVRGIMLGALEWRKKHAKSISYWKSGATPTFKT